MLRSVKWAKYALKSEVLSRWPGAYWRLRRWLKGPLEPELELLPQLCSSAKLAVDVGSNWGAYAFALSHWCAGVVCFEPQPRLAEVVSRGLEARRNVQVHNIALSDHDDILELRIPRNDLGYATVEASNVLQGKADLSRGVETVRVVSRRLDDMGLGTVGFIKIDAEGHELEVLKGALGVIERDRPVLLVEVEERHRPGVKARMSSLLGDMGYRCFVLREGRLREHDLKDSESGSGAESTRNFVFLPGQPSRSASG